MKLAQLKEEIRIFFEIAIEVAEEVAIAATILPHSKANFLENLEKMFCIYYLRRLCTH